MRFSAWRSGGGPGAVSLLGTGKPGTEVLELDRDEFFRSGLELGRKVDLEAMIATWVRRLVHSLGDLRPMRGDAETIRPGTEPTVPAGSILTGRSDLVWVRIETGRFYPMGRTDDPALPIGPFLPLPPGRIWWLAEVEGRLSVRAIEDFPTIDSLITGMDAWHDHFLSVTARRLEMLEEDRRERLKLRPHIDRRRMAGAHRRLESVLRKAESGGAIHDRSSLPLLTVCRMLGVQVGLRVAAPPAEAVSEQGLDLGGIARFSGFRTREVALIAEWWRHDHGPLLGYWAKDDSPVALLPLGPGKYEYRDPGGGQKGIVDREVAARLKPRAHVFYRPLPPRPSGGLDLLRIGLRNIRPDLARLVLMGAAGGLLGLFMPYLTGVVFDNVIPEAASHQLFQIGVILVIAVTASALFEVARGLAIVRIEGRLGADIQAALWDRLLSLPVPFYRRFSAGDLAERSMGVNTIRRILSGVTINAVLAAIFSVFYLALLFYYDAALAWLAALATAVGFGITVLLGFRNVSIQNRIHEREGLMSGRLLQFLTGITKLRLAGAEERVFARWAESFAQKKKLAFKAGVIENISVSINAVFPIATAAIIFVWAGSGAGELSTGEFVAFYTAFLSLQHAALQMSDALTASLGIVPIYRRLRPIMEEVPEIDATKAHPGSLKGAIEISHLCFRYDENSPMILDDVGLNVSPGEFVAIVGESGSGKSTLMRLLLGFESPRTGAIYYDGQDLSALDVREVRRRIGVVLQNSRLLQGDIFHNVTGVSNLGAEDVWVALRMVGMEEEVRAMPMGLHTLVGPGGGTLSGGQKQRLLIARAIVNRPRMVFFDEGHQRPGQPRPVRGQPESGGVAGHPGGHCPSAQYHYQRRPDICAAGGPDRPGGNVSGVDGNGRVFPGDGPTPGGLMQKPTGPTGANRG